MTRWLAEVETVREMNFNNKVTYRKNLVMTRPAKMCYCGFKDPGILVQNSIQVVPYLQNR